MKIPMQDILRLTVAERLELVEAIWDSIAADSSGVPLTDAQRSDLEQRISDHYRDPSATQTWSEVREELEREE